MSCSFRACWMPLSSTRRSSKSSRNCSVRESVSFWPVPLRKESNSFVHSLVFQWLFWKQEYSKLTMHSSVNYNSGSFSTLSERECASIRRRIIWKKERNSYFAIYFLRRAYTSLLVTVWNSCSASIYHLIDIPSCILHWSDNTMFLVSHTYPPIIKDTCMLLFTKANFHIDLPTRNTLIGLPVWSKVFWFSSLYTGIHLYSSWRWMTCQAGITACQYCDQSQST